MRMLNARVVSQLVCTRHAGVIALLVAFVLVPLTVRADPIISVLPSSSNIIAGSVFSLDFVVGATDPGPADDVDDLFAYQFGIRFNPFLFSANSVSEGSLLSSAGSTLFVPGTIDNAAG